VNQAAGNRPGPALPRAGRTLAFAAVNTAAPSPSPVAAPTRPGVATALLIATLIACGVLAFLYARASRLAVAAVQEASAAESRARAAAEAVAVPPPPPSPAETWSRLASEDPAQFAANLHAAGFPDRIARALVAATLNERYDARRTALLGEEKVPPFWQARVAPLDPAKLAELRALAQEQQDQLVRLFGPDPRDGEAAFFRRRLFGDLPAEKLERVQRIQSDYADLQRQLRLEAGGVLLPQDRDDLTQLEQERRKDLAAALTPQELETFDLSSSATASALRVRLAAFNPTEVEFRKIFALQRDFDDRFNPASTNFNDEAALRERRAAELQFNANLKTALGDARYEDYRRAQDPGFRLASRLAERNQLPADTAAAVYNLQRDILQRAAAARNDPPALAALADEAGAKLEQWLGAPGAMVYKQQAGGWLRALQRTARAAPGASPNAAPPAATGGEAVRPAGGAP